MAPLDHELGRSLRQWRDRISPAAVGLPANGQRRASGLRREELALLAGLSADYIVRLEQGRATSPSAQVLTALARALRLSVDERDYLFRLAGQPVPSTGRINAHLTPGVQRLLDRLSDCPVAVYDAGWTLLAWNAIWAALMGDASAVPPGRARNLPWRHFVPGPGQGGYGRVVHTPEQTAKLEVEMVADLRAALARFPHEPDLTALIRDLRRESTRFDELWLAGAVQARVSDQKLIVHPEVGELTVDCDILTVHGADLRIVAYTAEPGSEAAEKLALLRVLGVQTLSS